MRKIFIIIFTTLTAIGLTFTACTKFVQIPPPTGQLTNSSVFQNDQTATAALLNIYIFMNYKGESWNMSQKCGLLSDELDGSHSQDLTNITQFYHNRMDPINTVGPWKTAFQYIYQANSILEGLQSGKSVNPTITKQLVGEAKFLRAYWHFYLVNCYGDVPIVTATDYKANTVKARSPKADVYNQIITDLEEAKALLNSNFVDASDTAISPDRVRPTQAAAQAMLARVFLFTKQYDSAAHYSTQLINNSELFELKDSLDDVFLSNSKEAIWQLAIPLPTSINTVDGNSFILISNPRIGNKNTATISAGLMSSFEDGDLRKSHWISSYISSSNDTFYFPYKYKVYISPDVTEYTMVLRLAEQYLIRAEARVQMQNTDLLGAVADLNMIRHRAGLPDYSGTMDGPSLFTAIMQERQVELFTEWGHRWFDLIRTGNINTVMNIAAPLKGGTWTSDGQLFPIPQSERNINVNLTQNPGY